MKVTAEQLEKIDFGKWDSADWRARIQHGKVFLEHHNSMQATRCTVNGWQLFGGTDAMSRETLARIDKLEEFIVSEVSASIIPDPGPNHTICSKEEATEFEYRFTDGELSPGGWSSMNNYHGSKYGTYYFRRPIAKPVTIPEPEVGEGFVFCDKKNATEAIHNSEHDKLGWGTWKPVCRFAFNEDSERYRFRRPIAKSKPIAKLPTVKLPKGSDWLPANATYGLRLMFIDDGENGLCHVPNSKEYRDAMAACVAAFDEANGIRNELLASLVNIHTSRVEDAFGSLTNARDFRITVSGTCDGDALLKFMSGGLVVLARPTNA